jgi:hypothetical protein
MITKLGLPGCISVTPFLSCSCAAPLSFPSIVMAANNDVGGLVANASSELDGVSAAYLAFDSNATTAWVSASTYPVTGSFAAQSLLTTGAFLAGEWLQIQFPVHTYVCGYNISLASLAAAPSAFSLLGSYDANVWAPLDSQTSPSLVAADDGTFQASLNFPFGAYPIAFPFVRLVVTASQGGSVSISELRIFGTTSASDIATSPNLFCRAGYYCVSGSFAETPAALGNFVPATGLSFQTLCPPGQHCNSTALTAPPGYNCSAGFFCSAGSADALGAASIPSLYSYDSFLIASAHGSNCMGINTWERNAAQAVSCNLNDATQRWRYSAYGFQFRIVNVQHPTYCLQHSYFCTRNYGCAEAARIVLCTYSDASDKTQQWTYDPIARTIVSGTGCILGQTGCHSPVYNYGYLWLLRNTASYSLLGMGKLIHTFRRFCTENNFFFFDSCLAFFAFSLVAMRRILLFGLLLPD